MADKTKLRLPLMCKCMLEEIYAQLKRKKIDLNNTNNIKFLLKIEVGICAYNDNAISAVCRTFKPYEFKCSCVKHSEVKKENKVRYKYLFKFERYYDLPF